MKDAKKPNIIWLLVFPQEKNSVASSGWLQLFLPTSYKKPDFP